MEIMSLKQCFYFLLSTRLNYKIYQENGQQFYELEWPTSTWFSSLHKEINVFNQDTKMFNSD